MIELRFMRIVSLTILLLLLFLIGVVPIYADGELMVTYITRITHPAVSADNLWQGEKYGGSNGGSGPWNRNFAKIFIREANMGAKHPNYPNWIPRGLVWGNVSTLKSLGGTITYSNNLQKLWNYSNDYSGSLEDYIANTHAVPSKYTYASGELAVPLWSKIVGEEDIFYALQRVDNYTVKLWKYNTETRAETLIASLYDSQGRVASSPMLLGWRRSNNNIFISIKNEAGWDAIGWEVDATQDSQSFDENDSNFFDRYYRGGPNKCLTEGYNWPFISIHEGRSPDGLYISGYGWDEGASRCENEAYGRTLEYQDNYWNNLPAPAHRPIHPTWPQNSNNWWVAGDDGTNSAATRPDNPYISTHRVYQTYFDRATKVFTHYELIRLNSAGVWDDGIDDYNYKGHIVPTMRKDDEQMMIISYNGSYSEEDKQQCLLHPTLPNCNVVPTNYSTAGMFLVDLSPISGSTTCTSFTYTAWNECQPNNTQTRTVISSSPAGCTGGTPLLEQTCTYTGTPLHSLLKATSTPVIDGSLGEYALAESISFLPSSGGNTVTVRILWDSVALYFGINVTDTQLNASVTTKDGSVWNEDSIEWFIDTYYDGGGDSNPDLAFMRTDDYQGIVNILNTKYDSQGTTSGTPSSLWNGTWQSALKIIGTNNNNADTDSGYAIEIKIPWTSIGYSSAPSADTLLGMSFAVNDKDSNGTYSKMWLSNAGANQNASNWQKVLLSGSLVTVDTTPPGHPLALMIQ